MTGGLNRRLDVLERALAPVRLGPAFVMAGSHAEADQEIERLKAEYPDGMPDTLFIMISPCPSRWRMRMSSALHRRIERLAQRCGEVAGRLIVVEMHEARCTTARFSTPRWPTRASAAPTRISS